MKNLGQMMKQAQQMQARMQEMQEKLAAVEVEGTSGGGMATVTLNGKGEMRGLKLDPALISGGDGEVIEDLIIAAFNDAKTKVDARAAEEMSKITGGLNLPPGLGLPF